MEYNKYEEPSLYFILFFGRYFLNPSLTTKYMIYDIFLQF